MSYEYDLRRLFRPPIESLSTGEQLTYYRQRDLVPSHLYRIGTHLFGRSSFGVRRRVIDAAHYTPHGHVNHQAMLNRSLDGREAHDSGTRDRTSGRRITKSQSEPSVNLSQTGSLSEAEYRKWLTDRRALRDNLDSLGANERWLLSKERTPLESSLLTKLKNGPRIKEAASAKSDMQLPKVLSNSSEEASSKSPNPRKALLKFKRQMIKEITQLEQYLATNRRRSISLLATADKAHTRFITVSDMLSVMNKMKAPLSQAAIEILLQVLDIRDDGLLDYQQLLNGSILRAVEDHFQRLEAEMVVEDDVELPVETSCDDMWTMKAADLEKKHGAPSTLTGDTGIMADQYKQEEVKQFSQLISHCKEKGIVLNWQVAEKALLIPPDRPKHECLTELRQAGLSLLSRHFAESPQEQAQRKQKDTYEGFGRAYKELRGKRKSTFMKLPTGGARVKAKTDCWLSFEEYLKLTEHIRSRPGFKYKDHGLPDNNAFWPGALLDKLRLWMPNETLLDKPYSLYNVFQPVHHPKIYNPYSPMVEQRTSWPENVSGYVQFGSQNRKQYQL